MELTAIVPGEQVAVWNVTTGARIETYAILPGDRVIIAAFLLANEKIDPKMIAVDGRNQVAVALAQ